MSYIRAGWGLTHIEGKSDSYIIGTDKGIESYGLGDMGIAELLCDCIDEYYKDDPEFKQWFKQEVTERLGVKLRKQPITFEQSKQILMDEIDAVTLEPLKKNKKLEDTKDDTMNNGF